MGTIEISTAATTIIIAISTLFSLILVMAAVIGFFMRWKRSTVELCRILIAIILTTLIVALLGLCFNFSEPFADLIESQLSPDTSQSAIQLIAAALYSLIVPFLFVLLFIINAQILRIPAHFISKALHIDKRSENEDANAVIYPANDTEPQENTGKKLLEQFGGALISMFTALVIICVCFLPFTGLFCTVADGISEFAEEAVENDVKLQVENQGGQEIIVDGYKILDKDGIIDTVALNAVVNTSITPLRKNFFVAASYSAPMKFMYTNITRVRVQGVSVSFGKEMDDFLKLASHSICLVTDFENYGENQIAATDAIADYMINSEFRCKLTADLLSSLAKSIEKPNDNELLGRILEVLENTTKDSVAEDVATARDIFKSAIKNDLPKAIANASGNDDGYILILDGINSDFVYDLLSAIKKNNHFGGLVSPALNYAMQMILKSFDAEDIEIQAGADLQELSEEQLKSEAENLAAALSNIKNVVLSLKNSDDKQQDSAEAFMNMDIAQLGAFIDRCQDSLLLGNGTREVFVSMLRSERFSENGLDDVFDVIAEHLEQGDDFSMERTLVATKELVKVMSDYQNNSSSTAELSASMKKIVENLDPETATVINEMIPKIDSSMIDGGNNVSETVTQKIITSFVETLSSEEAKEIVTNDEELEKEAQAIDMVLGMIKSATSGTVYSAEDIKGVVGTLADSKIATNALVSAAYDESGKLTDDIQLLNNSATAEDKQAVVYACKEYYDEEKSALSASEIVAIKAKLTAIASIFGEDISAQVASWK